MASYPRFHHLLVASILLSCLLLLVQYGTIPRTAHEHSINRTTSSTQESSTECFPQSQRNNSSQSVKQRYPPHQHVYYLKTHKTGSTTMYSIFAEYCRFHDLLPLMPKGVHINQKPPVINGQLLLVDNNNTKYDMVFNHHVYSSHIFTHLYNDSIKITTLREPYKQFVSSVTYFKREGLPYLQRVPKEDPVLALLKYPKKYEAKGYTSYTNNRQSMDLGYDLRHSFNDTEYIDKFIKLTEQRFDFILITDYFQESLVMMKRLLHWSTQDILYFAKLTQNKSKHALTENSNNNDSHNTESLYRKLHAQSSQADIALYSHFLARFKQRTAAEIGLDEEVAEFNDILGKVRDYCGDSHGKTASILNLPSGKWTDSIYLLPYKCKWLKMPEVPFTDYLKKRQKLVLSHIL